MNQTTPDAKIFVPPPAREIRNLEHRIERLVQAIRKDQKLAANAQRDAALGSRVR